ncbi:MAG: DUF488 family protein, partial [Candidatus Acidiferrum sp.]
PEFQTAIQKVIAVATRKRVALMCAEAVPWRCHRSLIADALLARGFPVDEIQGTSHRRSHSLTPWARIEGTQVTYPSSRTVGKLHLIPTASHRRTKMIRIKRVYEKAAPEDGRRFLVERLWPRGIKKSALDIDAWLKEVGPSTALRKWFGHEPKRWEEFHRRYFSELDRNVHAWTPILEAVRQGRVTLLFSSHDTEHNNAVALKEYLEFKMRGKEEVHINTRNAAA